MARLHGSWPDSVSFVSTGITWTVAGLDVAGSVLIRYHTVRSVWRAHIGAHRNAYGDETVRAWLLLSYNLLFYSLSSLCTVVRCCLLSFKLHSNSLWLIFYYSYYYFKQCNVYLFNCCRYSLRLKPPLFTTHVPHNLTWVVFLYFFFTYTSIVFTRGA